MDIFDEEKPTNINTFETDDIEDSGESTISEEEIIEFAKPKSHQDIVSEYVSKPVLKSYPCQFKKFSEFATILTNSRTPRKNETVNLSSAPQIKPISGFKLKLCIDKNGNPIRNDKGLYIYQCYTSDGIPIYNGNTPVIVVMAFNK